jgi:hypothetical protein
MDKVFRELQNSVWVEDPCPYALGRGITQSIVSRKYHLISFYEGSVTTKKLDKNYWKEVNYKFLEDKCGSTKLVWYEFLGKHIQLVD